MGHPTRPYTRLLCLCHDSMLFIRPPGCGLVDVCVFSAEHRRRFLPSRNKSYRYSWFFNHTQSPVSSETDLASVSDERRRCTSCMYIINDGPDWLLKRLRILLFTVFFFSCS